MASTACSLLVNRGLGGAIEVNIQLPSLGHDVDFQGAEWTTNGGSVVNVDWLIIREAWMWWR